MSARLSMVLVGAAVVKAAADAAMARLNLMLAVWSGLEKVGKECMDQVPDLCLVLSGERVNEERTYTERYYDTSLPHM